MTKALPPTLIRLLAGLLTVAAATACQRDAPEPGPLTSAELERAQALGDSATSQLVGALGGQLQQALQEGGPEHAMAFCAGMAQTLTDSVSARLGTETVVSRTALRVRNPRNRPDATDVEVLERFTAALQAGETLPAGVVETAAGGHTVRYYRPLMTGEVCTACHGPPEALAPGVLELVRRHYPDDQAVGFQVGELRGAVRVSLPRSRLAPEG